MVLFCIFKINWNSRNFLSTACEEKKIEVDSMLMFFMPQLQSYSHTVTTCVE